MFRKNSLKLAAVAILGIATLTGCAAGERDAEANTENDSVTDTSQDTAQNDAGDVASEGGALGGSYTLTVNGSSIDIEDPVVACEEMGGNFSIGVASSSGDFDAASGLGAVLTSGDNPSVISVGLVTVDGDAVAYAEGAGIGSAEVSVDGNTYEITGSGIITNLEDPTAMDEASFDFTVTCP